MTIPQILVFSGFLLQAAVAGESVLTTTYQPLNGLGTGRIAIVEVTCHHWHANSASSPVDLIGVRNVPPTDEPKMATADLNLASMCGLKFSTSDLGVAATKPKIVLNAVQMKIPEGIGYPKEEIVRAALECLRRVTPEKLAGTPVTVDANDADRAWLEKLVGDFNAHPHAQPLFPKN